MSTISSEQFSAEHQSELAAQYARDGFVVVPEVLSRDECRAFKEEGLRVLREHAKPNSSVFVGVAANSELFYKLASDARIVEVLRPLMPEGIMFMSDKFVWKSGEQSFGTPWHCDIAYWKNTRPKLSVWIPLDDVTAQNGALKVLPGGHKKEWLHGSHSGVEFGNRISELPENPAEQIICEMKAGGLLVFSDALPHASTPNIAGLDRYAVISTYHAPAPDEEFDKIFPARHVIAVAPSAP